MKNFLYHLHIFFSRVAKFFSSEKHLHNARFASPHELASLVGNISDNETRLLLGESRFNNVLGVKPTEGRRELGNVLICGPSRSGKTLLQESQIYTWKHSIIINDIKGELFAKTAGDRATKGKVYIIDPTSGVGNQHDPLEGRNTERELYASAKHLLYDPNDKDAIFTERAIKMLTQLFMAARLEGCRPIPYVGRLVNLGLNGVAGILNTISPVLATKFLDAEFESDKDFEENRFRISAWDSLSARLYSLLTDDIVRCFNGSDFTVKDLLFSKEPISVYLRWHESELLSLAPLIRLVWESMINELITAYDQASRKQDCQPVLLDIEEAGRTGIPNLPEHSTTVNGRGISMMIAIQSLSQLDALYGKYRADTLRNNMDSQIYYRQASQETAEYLQKCLGYKSGFAHSENSHNGIESSKGLSEREIPLMTAQEIKQMDDETILGFHRGLPPFQAKRMDWRHFPSLLQRQRISPPQLFPLPQLEDKPFSNKVPASYIDPDRVVVGVDSGRLLPRLPSF